MSNRLEPIFLEIQDRLTKAGIISAIGLEVQDPYDERLPLAVIHFGPDSTKFDSTSNPVETAAMQVTVQYIDETDLRNPLIDMCKMQAILEQALFEESACSGRDTLNGLALNFTKESLVMAQPSSWDRHGVVEYVCNVFFVNED